PGGVVSDPVDSFTWTPSAGAEKYNFYITYPDGQYLEVPDLLPADLGCSSGTCTLSAASLSTPVERKGRYVWAVRAVDPEGMTAVDDGNGFMFRVGSADMPGEFSLVSPVSPRDQLFFSGNFEPGQIQEFVWTVSPRATRYRLLLIFPGGLPGDEIKFYGLNDGDEIDCDASTCRMPVDQGLIGGAGLYWWTVEAFNAEGASSAPGQYFAITSPLGTFDLKGPEYGLRFTETLPELLSFSWGESSGAVSYRLVVQHVDDNNSTRSTVLDAPGLVSGDAIECIDGTCSFDLDTTLLTKEGRYVWTVFAIAPGGQFTLAGNRQWEFNVDFNALRNESFEAARQGVPSQWVASGLTSDRVICVDGTAFDGKCSFRFTGQAGENSSITQVIRDPEARGFLPGKTLTLTANVASRNLSTGATIRVRLVYTDGTVGFYQVPIPRNTGGEYREIGHQGIEITKPLDRVIIRIGYANPGATGSFRVDDVWLGVKELAPATPPPGT
ncbi:MAG: hypothetical protein ACKPE6_07690, partial [Gammaproteobacteria bacterium]